MASRKTKNPRISFVPSDQVLALVKKLSETSGASMASIVSELMDDVAVVMLLQLEALKTIAERPDQVKKHFEDMAEKSKATIDQAVIDFSASEDQRTVEAKKAKRRRSSGPT